MDSNDLNSQGDKRAEDGPANGAQDERKSKVSASDDKTIWKVVGETVFAGLCGLLSNNCFSTDHKAWGVFWSFFAAGFFLAGATTAVSKRLPPKKAWTVYAGVMAVIGIWFTVWIVRLNSEPVKPHLALWLKASDTREHTLILTNDFLLIKGRGPESKIPKNAGFLVIRTPFDRTNVVLRFGVLNDSAPQYAAVDDSTLTVDAAYLELMILAGPGQAPAVRWSPDPLWKQSGPTNARLLRFIFPISILPGGSESAPDLVFTNSIHPTDKLLVTARMRGKGVPQINLLFNLVFIPSNEPIPPSLLGPTNAVGVLILRKTN